MNIAFEIQLLQATINQMKEYIEQLEQANALLSAELTKYKEVKTDEQP